APTTKILEFKAKELMEPYPVEHKQKQAWIRKHVVEGEWFDMVTRIHENCHGQPNPYTEIYDYIKDFAKLTNQECDAVHRTMQQILENPPESSPLFIDCLKKELWQSSFTALQRDWIKTKLAEVHTLPFRYLRALLTVHGYDKL